VSELKMEPMIPLRQKLIEEINELPAEVLPELVNFVEYLRFKVNPPLPLEETEMQTSSGSSFLLSIADLGASEEDDISERDEEILASEIDPIRGWSLKPDNSQ
jgi:hypothetical protein